MPAVLSKLLQLFYESPEFKNIRKKSLKKKIFDKLWILKEKRQKRKSELFSLKICIIIIHILSIISDKDHRQLNVNVPCKKSFQIAEEKAVIINITEKETRAISQNVKMINSSDIEKSPGPILKFQSNVKTYVDETYEILHQLNLRHFTVQNSTLADGNCFFHGVFEQLNRQVMQPFISVELQGALENAFTLRNETIRYGETSLDHHVVTLKEQFNEVFNNLIDSRQNIDILTYLERMKNPSIFATETLCRLTAYYINFNINIILASNSEENPYLSLQANTENRPTIYLVNICNEHFQSVIPVRNVTSNPSEYIVNSYNPNLNSEGLPVRNVTSNPSEYIVNSHNPNLIFFLNKRKSEYNSLEEKRKMENNRKKEKRRNEDKVEKENRKMQNRNNMKCKRSNEDKVEKVNRKIKNRNNVECKRLQEDEVEK